MNDEYSVEELVEFLKNGRGLERRVLELKDTSTSEPDRVEDNIEVRGEVVEDGRGTE